MPTDAEVLVETDKLLKRQIAEAPESVHRAIANDPIVAWAFNLFRNALQRQVRSELELAELQRLRNEDDSIGRRVNDINVAAIQAALPDVGLTVRCDAGETYTSVAIRELVRQRDEARRQLADLKATLETSALPSAAELMKLMYPGSTASHDAAPRATGTGRVGCTHALGHSWTDRDPAWRVRHCLHCLARMDDLGCVTLHKAKG